MFDKTYQFDGKDAEAIDDENESMVTFVLIGHYIKTCQKYVKSIRIPPEFGQP